MKFWKWWFIDMVVLTVACFTVDAVTPGELGLGAIWAVIGVTSLANVLGFWQGLRHDDNPSSETR